MRRNSAEIRDSWGQHDCTIQSFAEIKAKRKNSSAMVTPTQGALGAGCSRTFGPDFPRSLLTAALPERASRFARKFQRYGVLDHSFEPLGLHSQVFRRACHKKIEIEICVGSARSRFVLNRWLPVLAALLPNSWRGIGTALDVELTIGLSINTVGRTSASILETCF